MREFVQRCVTSLPAALIIEAFILSTCIVFGLCIGTFGNYVYPHMAAPTDPTGFLLYLSWFLDWVWVPSMFGAIGVLLLRDFLDSMGQPR